MNSQYIKNHVLCCYRFCIIRNPNYQNFNPNIHSKYYLRIKNKDEFKETDKYVDTSRVAFAVKKLSLLFITCIICRNQWCLSTMQIRKNQDVHQNVSFYLTNN